MMAVEMMMMMLMMMMMMMLMMMMMMDDDVVDGMRNVMRSRWKEYCVLMLMCAAAEVLMLRRRRRRIISNPRPLFHSSTLSNLFNSFLLPPSTTDSGHTSGVRRDAF